MARFEEHHRRGTDDEGEHEVGLAVGHKKPGQQQVRPALKQKQSSFEKAPKSILLNKKDLGKNISRKFSDVHDPHDDDDDDDDDDPLADMESPCVPQMRSCARKRGLPNQFFLESRKRTLKKSKKQKQQGGADKGADCEEGEEQGKDCWQTAKNG